MALTRTQILEEVKDTIGITGNYQDRTLLRHIEDVSDYMASAGVPAAVIASPKALGAISRGVSDLWNYGSGGGTLSPYFYQRVIQLSHTQAQTGTDENGEPDAPETPGKEYVLSDADKAEIVAMVLQSINASGSPARIGTVTLPAANWIGNESPYSQVVDVEGATANSQIDLTPSVEQLTIFYEKDLTFVTENDNGKVTVYAIGQKPERDYTIQITITEVRT